MLRGTTLFRCPNCGHVFKALDIEDNATVYSMPMPCPRCGAKSSPVGPLYIDGCTGLLSIVITNLMYKK